VNQRKVYFLWTVAVVLSGIVAWNSYYYIDKVFPLVCLSITADRDDVIASSKTIAHDLAINLDGYTPVVQFSLEEELQCFVELEAGGKDAFVELLHSKMYHPYYWDVRYFKEQNVEEMHFLFSPQGEKIGYFCKISEEKAGQALTQAQAQRLVELQAHAWCKDFTAYQLIEHNEETQDNGRIDHDFVYERSDIALGKGLYRFSVRVCGDVITECKPMIKIPDNFVRRYQQMRSANNLLASLASFIFRTIYFLLFGLIGLLFFYRRKYLRYQQALFAGIVIASAIFLKGLNEYPLWAFEYYTFQSLQSFLTLKFFSLFFGFLMLLGFVFSALLIAEAAGRLMYPAHVQFFKIPTNAGIRSFEVFQQVCIGYLATPWILGFMLLFSYVTQHWYGWWHPAGSFSDPNVLASYFPWFGAAAISLQAGFFEEIAFRALPFAMMAFVTRKSKHQKFWLLVTYVLQAMVFGACHANYPNQPFYARLVELIIPSFIFGFLYNRFGLLPGIIAHFIFDTLLFALPIFVSDLIWSKILVIICIALPLIVMLLARIYYGSWITLDDGLHNKDSVLHDVASSHVALARLSQGIASRYKRIMIIFGIVGLLISLGGLYFYRLSERLLISRSDALRIAQTAIQNKFGVTIDDSWTMLAMVQDEIHTPQSRFLWQVYGSEIYALARSSYINGMFWAVRCVQFNKNVEDRAQEYQVFISSCNLQEHQHRQPESGLSGHVIKMVHILPEHTPGADVSEQDAQKIMFKFIKDEYCVQEEDLKIISVTTDKLDHRRDWTFVVQDTQVFGFPLQGQARIEIRIAGDTVTQFSRYIFVPETWSRQDQATQMNLGLIKIVLWFLLILLMFFGCALGLPMFIHSLHGTKILKKKIIFVGTVVVILLVNSLLTTIFHFNTAEPFFDQMGRTSLTLLSFCLWQTFIWSFILSIGSVGLIKNKYASFGTALWQSALLAAGFVGVGVILYFIQPSLMPIVQDYSAVLGWHRTLQHVVTVVEEFYTMMAIGIAISFVFEFLEERFNWAGGLQLVWSILAGVGVQGLVVHTVYWWIFAQGTLIGFIFFLLYKIAFRFDSGLLPLFFGWIIIAKNCLILWYPVYDGAVLDALVAIGVMVLTMKFFYHQIEQ
jgi:hypothetical protein